MEKPRNVGNQLFCQPNRPYSGTTKPSGVSLNVHLAVPTTTSAAQDGSHTPNTPEILNSIVNMQAAREAREAAAVGPFGAEFARQCAIRPVPSATITSPSDDMNQDVGGAPTMDTSASGYSYAEVFNSFSNNDRIEEYKYNFIDFKLHFSYLVLIFMFIASND